MKIEKKMMKKINKTILKQLDYGSAFEFIKYSDIENFTSDPYILSDEDSIVNLARGTEYNIFEENIENCEVKILNCHLVIHEVE